MISYKVVVGEGRVHFDDVKELLEEIKYLDKDLTETYHTDAFQEWTFTISTHEATVLSLKYDVFNKCERL